jgi:hypothetical protein
VLEESRSHRTGRRPSDLGFSRPSNLNGQPRPVADTSEIDEALSHPGSVRINVKGAFIVDEDSATPTTPDERSSSPGRHESKDIRLPNHTAIVSHIAIDVGLFQTFFWKLNVPRPMMSSYRYPLRTCALISSRRSAAHLPSLSTSRAKHTRQNLAAVSTS